MQHSRSDREWSSDVCASDLPLASSATVPDPTEAPVQTLEAVKNVKVTVPVGVPKLPLTVALSCTVVPAGTEGTTLWLGSWVSVPTGGGRSVTVSTSQGFGPEG